MRPLLALLILVSTQVSGDSCFPGNSSLDSPTDRYSIDWKEPSDGETHHLFFRTNAVPPTRQPLLDFGRSACIYWEPGETHFALTWNMGSNVSETYIYPTNDISKRIEIWDLIPTYISDQMRGYFHVYVRAKEWSKAGLAISITGHGREEHNEQILDVTIMCIKNNTGWRCDG